MLAQRHLSTFGVGVMKAFYLEPLNDTVCALRHCGFGFQSDWLFTLHCADWRWLGAQTRNECPLRSWRASNFCIQQELVFWIQWRRNTGPGPLCDDLRVGLCH